MDEEQTRQAAYEELLIALGLTTRDRLVARNDLRDALEPDGVLFGTPPENAATARQQADLWNWRLTLLFDQNYTWVVDDCSVLVSNFARDRAYAADFATAIKAVRLLTDRGHGDVVCTALAAVTLEEIATVAKARAYPDANTIALVSRSALPGLNETMGQGVPLLHDSEYQLQLVAGGVATEEELRSFAVAHTDYQDALDTCNPKAMRAAAAQYRSVVTSRNTSPWVAAQASRLLANLVRRAVDLGHFDLALDVIAPRDGRGPAREEFGSVARAVALFSLDFVVMRAKENNAPRIVERAVAAISNGMAVGSM